MSDERALAAAARAWPFEEARKIVERIGGKTPAKGHVLFETGYGPSGLPHIGTFGEVVRTTMVRHAFQLLCPDIPTRLFAFSDDMDGLRKVPDTVPASHRDSFSAFVDQSPYIGGVPLTRIPDPFEHEDGADHASYGAHNNAMLRSFIDKLDIDGFQIEYDFQSSTDWYSSGRFDGVLRQVLSKYDEIYDVAVRTVGEERRRNYGLFLPLVFDERIGRERYLYVKIASCDASAGTIDFINPITGKPVEGFHVTGGKSKLLWRLDWAMRWIALGVDYEMSGKDLIESVKLSSQVCRILGAKPPESFTYELFLDEKGEKISKSKGNGLTVEEWRRYAPDTSLALFMYQQPRRAKRLFFDVIPKAVDEYLGYLDAFAEEDAAKRLENPAWHIHNGKPPRAELPLTFGILLNLAGVANAETKDVLWGFIASYRPGAAPEKMPILDRLVGFALAYYRDFVKPAKQYRAPTDQERAALADLEKALGAIPPGASPEDIQNQVYEVGKRHGFANLRDWFKAQYEVLLGQSQGPRMGTFIALYGLDQTRALIRRALAGENLAAA
jgi:lysyl-tRNA synthetase class 1